MCVLYVCTFSYYSDNLNIQQMYHKNISVILINIVY